MEAHVLYNNILFVVALFGSLVWTIRCIRFTDWLNARKSPTNMVPFETSSWGFGLFILLSTVAIVGLFGQYAWVSGFILSIVSWVVFYYFNKYHTSEGYGTYRDESPLMVFFWLNQLGVSGMAWFVLSLITNVTVLRMGS